MNDRAEQSREAGITRFRVKLLVRMMLMVFAVTALALYLAQRKVAAEVEHDFQQQFHGELASLHRIQDLRHAALAERCRTLARRPRIHAALEDNALDLLYPSAKNELRDVMEGEDEQLPESGTYTLHARFYRFLDANGAVISPPDPDDVGQLRPEEEAQLALNTVLTEQQLGYLHRKEDDKGILDEVIAMPIVSSETGQVIAAIVLGFKPVEFGTQHAGEGIKSGIWVNGDLHLPGLTESARKTLAAELPRIVAKSDHEESSVVVGVDGAPHLLAYKRLNPHSLFSPAYEVCIYPLAKSIARQRQLRWQIVAAGAMVLLAGLTASHFISTQLSAPVEKLAVDSAENRVQRERAEAALEVTSKELERSARFSADTSHQLKTPVTVLRAGLEALLSRENLPADVREEISVLIHQTFRLTSVIQDLLLLSRMDAGRLQLDLQEVDLTLVVNALIDDLDALSDSVDLTIEPDFSPALRIAGEKRYTAIILQNLLENARKYNRPGGRIRVAAREEDGFIHLNVANTGRGIPPSAQEHIFERFHRGSIGEDVPGHGLGLNLARELARLHGGDLRLVGSEEDWTEFEVRFRLAEQPAIRTLEIA
ncbi:sensor histidine kinase [Verrucomicrobiota bacterium sgz303538]